MKDIYHNGEIWKFSFTFLIISILVTWFVTVSSSVHVSISNAYIGLSNWAETFFLPGYIMNYLLGGRSFGIIIMTTIVFYMCLGAFIGFLWVKVKQRYPVLSQPVLENEKKIPAFLLLGQVICFLLFFAGIVFSTLIIAYRSRSPFLASIILIISVIGAILSGLTIIKKRRIQQQQKKWILVAQFSSVYIILFSIIVLLFSFLFLKMERNKQIGVGLLLFAVTLFMNGVHSIRFLRKG